VEHLGDDRAGRGEDNTRRIRQTLWIGFEQPVAAQQHLSAQLSFAQP